MINIATIINVLQHYFQPVSHAETLIVSMHTLQQALLCLSRAKPTKIQDMCIY